MMITDQKEESKEILAKERENNPSTSLAESTMPIAELRVEVKTFKESHRN